MNSSAIAQTHQPIPAPTAGHISVRLSELEQTTIYCYENEVPPFVERELDRLYSNFFSTVTHFKASGRIDNASTYVASKEGKVIAVFLFRQCQDEVHVLNEVIEIDQDEVNRFSQYIFATYGSVDVVSFHAVRAEVVRLRLPCQRINCLEDIVLALPGMVEDYFARLGKSTRKTIKNYMNKLKRDFPSFQSKTYEREEANEEDIRTIIELNRVRLLQNGKVSTFDEAATKRIIKSVKVYGMVCVATIDGKICAGSISYRVGKNYFMHISAHDPHYDNYRLGVLYRYLTICECIRQGGRECHFLWGRQEYKFSLLGVQRDLHDLVVYRSRKHFLLHSGMACQAVLKGVRRQATLWVHAWRDRTGGMTNLAAKFWSRFGMPRRSA